MVYKHDSVRNSALMSLEAESLKMLEHIKLMINGKRPLNMTPASRKASNSFNGP